MKRKLLAILTAVCMTATFVGGSATIWAAQEESDRDYADDIRTGSRF